MMKKFLLLFASLGIVYGQETTHVDFDTNNPDIVFNSWNSSASFSKITNPGPDAVNGSANVGQFTAGSDNGIGIGVIDVNTIFTTPFDLTALSTFKMKVWSSEEVTITFHLENAPDWGNNIEVTASVTAGQLSQWVELSFDFSSFSNIFMNNIVIIVNGPAWTLGDSLFFDDIKGPNLYTTPAQVFSPANGDTEASITSNLEITTNGSFRNIDDSAITDPTSNVGLRLNDVNGTDLDFSASISDTSKITIDPTLNLDNSTTYWFGIIDNSIEYSDDMAVTAVSASFTTKAAATGPINVTMFDYETPATSVGFGSWGPAGFAQVTNPGPDAVNGSANVGEFSHDGSGGYIGIESAGTFDFIDFSETPYFRIKVWVDKPVDLIFKLQNNPSYWDNPSEQTYSISAGETSKWIDITFDFGAVTATNYNRVVLYFDGSQAGGSAGGDKYYFDAIEKSSQATLSTKYFKIAGLTTYPNPTTSSWAISTKNQVIKSIEVYNLLGSRVLSLKPNALKANVDASSLAPGMYITNITTELGTASRKLIKQ